MRFEEARTGGGLEETTEDLTLDAESGSGGRAVAGLLAEDTDLAAFAARTAELRNSLDKRVRELEFAVSGRFDATVVGAAGAGRAGRIAG